MLILGFVPGCGSSSHSEIKAKQENSIDQILSGVEAQSMIGSRILWKMTASRARNALSRDGALEEKIYLKSPHTEIYSGGEISHVLRSQEGEIDLESGKARFIGQVVVTSTVGVKLEAEWLDYLSSKNLVTSSSPVVLTQKKMVTKGIGMEGSLDRLVIFNQTVEIQDMDP